MDEVTLFTHQPDGSLLITMGVPEADVPKEIKDNAVMLDDPITDGLVIYGRGVWPDDPSDRKYVARMKRRGQVFAECFSVESLRGEVGCHPLAAITEITREEFLAAKERGWTDGREA
jgi:hypothetical protein